MENGKIVIYRTADGETSIDVKLENDTVWLTQAQMAELFQKDQSVIARHIRNVFKEGELEEMSNMQILHNTFSKYKPTGVYSLDVIISVGYRVKGYAVNKQLTQQKYDELKLLVQVLGRTVKGQEVLSSDESRTLLDVVVDYTYALDTLDKYDYQQLDIHSTTNEQRFKATYENAMLAIQGLKSFGGEDLYPSVEEKAAMLLYLVTKNHSFSDGNKRIAATLFLWFLDNNGILYNPDGTKRIADNTLVALTLMIAESRTEEKDMMVKVVVNLINKENW